MSGAAQLAINQHLARVAFDLRERLLEVFDQADVTSTETFDVAGSRLPTGAVGEWLAAHVPGARTPLFVDQGHLSLWSQVDDMLTELRELGGLS